jgi:hypothetical protein
VQGKRDSPSLTSWPKRLNLTHPIPYTSAEDCAVAFGSAILCADVMTSNSADGIIVVFVLGLIPPFRMALTQTACVRYESII